MSSSEGVCRNRTSGEPRTHFHFFSFSRNNKPYFLVTSKNKRLTFGVKLKNMNENSYNTRIQVDFSENLFFASSFSAVSIISILTTVLCANNTNYFVKEQYLLLDLCWHTVYKQGTISTLSSSDDVAQLRNEMFRSK